MTKKGLIALIFGSLILPMTLPVFVSASFESGVEADYNTAVQGQDTLDGLDVSLKETTISSLTNLSSTKEVEIQVSGIGTDQLQADVKVKTEETEEESFYQSGYYYSDTSRGKEKQEMAPSDMWSKIDSEIHLGLTGNYLRMLYSEPIDSNMVQYHFAATPETLGDYSQKLLSGAGDGQGVSVDAFSGTMDVDSEGHIVKRNLQLIYSVETDDDVETFCSMTEEVFNKSGSEVKVQMPDLSKYKSQNTEKPIETITQEEKTVYATADVNVRAAGNLSAVVLGGLTAGSGITQTGYTSDGWIQVLYNDSTGYIWGEYISETKPVLTSSSSGIMYATSPVNVRDTYSSDGKILGVLNKDDSIEITGTTNNGWIRVKFDGQTGYVFSDYLSWSKPVKETYVKSGCMTGVVVEASYGSLTIQRDDGQGNATFNTTYASMNFRDNMYTGDWVEVFYSGSGSPYTASSVNDYTRHSASSEEKLVSEEGVVLDYGFNTLIVSCQDGLCRSFDVSSADLEMPGDLHEGMYVEVYWMSRTNGLETDNIRAFRVRG